MEILSLCQALRRLTFPFILRKWLLSEILENLENLNSGEGCLKHSGVRKELRRGNIANFLVKVILKLGL